MKYLCLIYVDERRLDALPKSESDCWRSEAGAFVDALRDSRRHLASAALEPVRAALTVRKRDGRITTTHGPFAETAEQLGGFVLIEAANLDDAIDAASRVPAARFGSVEVRPVRDLRGTAGVEVRPAPGIEGTGDGPP